MGNSTRSRCTILIALFLVVGCGGGGDTAPAADAPAASNLPAAPSGSATISGVVKFIGAAPKRQRLRLDEECQAMHAEPVLAENVIVNDNGTLDDVFVYVKSGIEGGPYAPPADPVIFDQHGCTYHPHVFGIQVGQSLKILNSDPLLHNIHVMPTTNRPYNFGMPKKGDERERAFKVAEEEVMVKIKCDVHPWMHAWAGVLPHSFYSVSDTTGAFSLQNLPAGTYVIEAWHEQYGSSSQTVTIGDGESATLEFSFGEGA